jgi:hypothetical protein
VRVAGDRWKPSSSSRWPGFPVCSSPIVRAQQRNAQFRALDRSVTGAISL